jgi:guanosine-3',5'-bis(diphosphate) 3'-pyrophosphohydrolase
MVHLTTCTFTSIWICKSINVLHSQNPKNNNNMYITLDEFQSLSHCIDFAAKAHHIQRRKNEAQSNYINHPLSMMNMLVQYGNYSNEEYHFPFFVFLVALLHDTIEDTSTTFEEIQALFGSQVADGVQMCTDDKSLGKVERKRIQIQKAAKVSRDVSWVKMVDILDNVSDLINVNTAPPSMCQEEIQGCLLWRFTVYQNLPKRAANYLDRQLNEIWSERGFDKLSKDEQDAGLEKYYDLLTIKEAKRQKKNT